VEPDISAEQNRDCTKPVIGFCFRLVVAAPGRRRFFWSKSVEGVTGAAEDVFDFVLNQVFNFRAGRGEVFAGMRRAPSISACGQERRFALTFIHGTVG
jgi:hypothetical protein